MLKDKRNRPAEDDLHIMVVCGYCGGAKAHESPVRPDVAAVKAEELKAEVLAEIAKSGDPSGCAQSDGKEPKLEVYIIPARAAEGVYATAVQDTVEHIEETQSRYAERVMSMFGVTIERMGSQPMPGGRNRHD